MNCLGELGGPTKLEEETNKDQPSLHIIIQTPDTVTDTRDTGDTTNTPDMAILLRVYVDTGDTTGTADTKTDSPLMQETTRHS